MLNQLRLSRPAARSRLKRAGPIAAVFMLALVLVPAASSGNYADPSGDNTGGAGDVTGVTVAGDKGTGQIVFRIAGSNIASSKQNVLFLDIDSDANPNTGNLTDDGADYAFFIDDDSYGFAHWSGSAWVDTTYATVRVTGGPSQITVSVNRSELGNTSDFNFSVTALNISISGTTIQAGHDSAPDDGEYNYSLDANGPQINAVDIQTTPSGGPKAGKLFVIAPTALHLPPDGRMTPATLTPESYSCSAKLGAKNLGGTGTGGCTVAIPKKKARGKKLTVQLTVNYEGAAKVFPLTFKVS
jgi:hypothetical protein